MNHLEVGLDLHLDFEKLAKIGKKNLSVVPVVVQDADTQSVLILGYMNQTALTATLETQTLTLWSTSRNELWIKGDTSGNTFQVLDVLVNCEQNSLLVLVRPQNGGACHVKNPQGSAYTSCYYRRLVDTDKLTFL